MKVKDILSEKGTEVISIEQNNTVFDAMNMFANNKVGSLLVLDDKGGIVGIMAARDVLMATLRSCEKIRETFVKEIMTKDIIIAEPDDDLDYIRSVMTANRIRHLPIVEETKLFGIVSIGDVIKAQLNESEGFKVENHYLKDYIIGKYPA